MTLNAAGRVGAYAMGGTLLAGGVGFIAANWHANATRDPNEPPRPPKHVSVPAVAAVMVGGGLAALLGGTTIAGAGWAAATATGGGAPAALGSAAGGAGMVAGAAVAIIGAFALFWSPVGIIGATMENQRADEHEAARAGG